MLKIFNSLGKKLEDFKPLKDKKAGIYVCGPTVYSPDHLGHARTWIFFDWLRRYLKLEGYKVNFVQNITDAGHLTGDSDVGEDKIEAQARKEKKTPQEIARYYEAEYLSDLASLNILLPDKNPRATDHIKDIIQYIEVLIEKKHAYEVDGNVYFDISTSPAYGKLSGLKLDQLREAVRINADPKKKNPFDFALWLRADKQLQKWPSPWGEGYPGWHIECSVMALKYLGQPFDIHGGGPDNKFPHHENEIAQSEAFADKPLARYWLHTGVLLINGQKMAKSAGNFVTVKDALRENSADTIKIAFMNNHWQKPLNWDKDAILEAKKTLTRLVRAKEQAQPIVTGFKTEISQILQDDFNVPRALAVIMKNISKLSRDDFSYIEELFGLKLEEVMKLTADQEDLLKERNKVRAAGDYPKADEIRKKLEEQGIMIEDTPTGTRTYRKG